MLIERGAKVLVAHRRLFVEDQPRWFAGVVDDYADGIARVTGFSWQRDPTRDIQRRSDPRTKLIALASGSLIVYQLPSETDLEAVEIRQSGAHTIWLTDGRKLKMDLSERI